MTPLGIVEGFFGEPWPWAARLENLSFLCQHGYKHYFYAPKADRFLREGWREQHPPDIQQHIRQLSRHCGSLHVALGIGLSPYGLHHPFREVDRQHILDRVQQLLDLGMRWLGLFFDDMNMVHPDLAQHQAEVVSWVCAQFPSLPLFVCPSYYSTDDVLDRVFGKRPDDYLATLGAQLDRDVQVFWTGPKVCTEAYTVEHLNNVCEQLRRKPWLWDNYPVNDGPRMCRFLHLRGFPRRDTQLAANIAGISVNPMNFPHLSRIPMLTLASMLSEEANDNRDAILRTSAERLLPKQLATLIMRDASQFQDEGLDQIDEASKTRLLEEYSDIDHPAAAEVVAWLNNKSQVGPECLTNN